MSVLDRIRRHAAVASGNFEAIFRNTQDITALPAATARLISEINSPEPDVGNLERILQVEPGLSARVLRVVNSSLFGLTARVTNVRHAVNLLGLRKIRELALTHVVQRALSGVDTAAFRHEALWADSLVMGLLARSFAKRFRPGAEEDAFTAGLLCHVALPVLLTSWSEYYTPTIEEWRDSPDTLSALERRHFGWDHGQAGAWIAKAWHFPEDLVCYIGSHNLSSQDLIEHELGDTLAVPISLAAMAPSVLKPQPEQTARMAELSRHAMGLELEDFAVIANELRQAFGDIRELFELSDTSIDNVVRELIESAG